MCKSFGKSQCLSKVLEKVFPSLWTSNVFEGAPCSFGEEIHTQHFNEVIMQTEKYSSFVITE